MFHMLVCHDQQVFIEGNFELRWWKDHGEVQHEQLCKTCGETFQTLFMLWVHTLQCTFKQHGGKALASNQHFQRPCHSLTSS